MDSQRSTHKNHNIPCDKRAYSLIGKMQLIEKTSNAYSVPLVSIVMRRLLDWISFLLWDSSIAVFISGDKKRFPVA